MFINKSILAHFCQVVAMATIGVAMAAMAMAAMVAMAVATVAMAAMAMTVVLVDPLRATGRRRAFLLAGWKHIEHGKETNMTWQFCWWPFWDGEDVKWPFQMIKWPPTRGWKRSLWITWEVINYLFWFPQYLGKWWQIIWWDDVLRHLKSRVRCSRLEWCIKCMKLAWFCVSTVGAVVDCSAFTAKLMSMLMAIVIVSFGIQSCGVFQQKSNSSKMAQILFFGIHIYIIYIYILYIYTVYT